MKPPESGWMAFGAGLALGVIGVLCLLGTWTLSPDDPPVLRVEEAGDGTNVFARALGATGGVQVTSIGGVFLAWDSYADRTRIGLFASNQYFTPMLKWDCEGGKVRASIDDLFYEASLSAFFEHGDWKATMFGESKGPDRTRVLVDRNIDGIFEREVTAPLATERRSITLRGEDWSLIIDGRRLLAFKGGVTQEVARVGGGFEFVGEQPPNIGKVP